MDRWTAEAENHTRTLADQGNKAIEANKAEGQHCQRDELYDLHNFVVLDSLLKDHLNLK